MATRIDYKSCANRLRYFSSSIAYDDHSLSDAGMTWLTHELRVGLDSIGQGYLGGLDTATLADHMAWLFDHHHCPWNHETIMALVDESDEPEGYGGLTPRDRDLAGELRSQS